MTPRRRCYATGRDRLGRPDPNGATGKARPLGLLYACTLQRSDLLCLRTLESDPKNWLRGRRTVSHYWATHSTYMSAKKYLVIIAKTSPEHGIVCTLPVLNPLATEQPRQTEPDTPPLVTSPNTVC